MLFRSIRNKCFRYPGYRKQTLFRSYPQDSSTEFQNIFPQCSGAYEDQFQAIKKGEKSRETAPLIGGPHMYTSSKYSWDDNDNQGSETIIEAILTYQILTI